MNRKFRVPRFEFRVTASDGLETTMYLTRNPEPGTRNKVVGSDFWLAIVIASPEP